VEQESILKMITRRAQIIIRHPVYYRGRANFLLIHIMECYYLCSENDTYIK